MKRLKDKLKSLKEKTLEKIDNVDIESAKEKIEQGKNLVNDYKKVISEKKT